MSDVQEKFERTDPWAKVVASGAAKVKRFEKIDALMKEVNGVKHYTVSYEVEMECINPIFIFEAPDGDYAVDPDDAENAEFKRQLQSSANVAKGLFVKELKPGDVDTRTGSIELTLYEKGWK